MVSRLPEHTALDAVQISLDRAMFSRNLQEFARLCALAANLETNGKLPADAAFDLIAAQWTALARSRTELLADASGQGG
jgi:hypothetical protein